MTARRLRARPISAAGFKPYGDLIEVSGPPDRIINAGRCGRYHDRAALDFGDGRAGLSLFAAEARALPHEVDLLERHPDGSQAFIPVNGVPMLLVVAQDDGTGAPSDAVAFLTAPGQVVNLHRAVWHGVLTPIGGRGVYAVVDRIGTGPNLEEHRLDVPLVVEAPE